MKRTFIFVPISSSFFCDKSVSSVRGGFDVLTSSEISEVPSKAIKGQESKDRGKGLTSDLNSCVSISSRGVTELFWRLKTKETGEQPDFS